MRKIERDIKDAVLDRGQFRIRRNAETQIGEADLDDQQERHEKEQQQPEKRTGHDRRAAGQSVAAREGLPGRQLHDVSTTPADALQRTYTSSPQVGESISPSARLDTFATTILPL